jgi:FkbM family methyltransferase
VSLLRRLVLAKRCGCSIAQEIQGVRQAVARSRLVTTIETSRRVIQRELGFDFWQTPYGRFWAPRYENSLIIVLAELASDSYATGEPGFLQNAVVLDCGAHLGTFVRQSLDRGARLVVAIEPGEEQLHCLRKTFAEEVEQGRVIVYPKGVWNTEGMLSFVDSGYTAGAHVTLESDSSAERIPVTTIDRLTEELKLTRVDLIKMDIEGAEHKALEGARATLARFKPKLALAGYHNHDDYLDLPAVVRRARPDYQWHTVSCYPWHGHIHPMTLVAR